MHDKTTPAAPIDPLTLGEQPRPDGEEHNNTPRYHLIINGMLQERLETIYDVWKTLDEEYEALEDQYAGEVWWDIEDHKTNPPRIAQGDKMPAAIWHAWSATADEFTSYLYMFGWDKK